MPTMVRADEDGNFQTSAMAVSHVGFADALQQSKPSPWTKRMWKLYFFLFIAFLNSCINGYDGTLMGGINVMKSYQECVIGCSTYTEIVLTKCIIDIST